MEYSFQDAISGQFILKAGDTITEYGTVTEFNGHTVQYTYVGPTGNTWHGSSQIAWLDGSGRLTKVGRRMKREVKA